jgi:hypothetical protein
MVSQARAEAAGRQALAEAEGSGKYKGLARLGYASRGIVYLIVGSFAVLAAFGGGRTTDTKGALQSLMGGPWGIAPLSLVALGLLAFAAWRAVQGIADADGHGRDGKGLVVRGGLLVSAVTHLSLALFAAGLMFGVGGGSGGDGGTQSWIAKLMQQPLGQWLVGIVGATVFGAGIAQIVKGWKAKFEKRFKPGYGALGWVRPLCRFGLIARGIVFLIIGGFIVVAAWRYDPRQARGLAGALQAIQEQPYGQALLGIVAFGLVAFGLYCGVEALYRRIGVAQAGDAQPLTRTR